MQRIYFDNAATTSLDQEVLNAMMPFLTEKFGNPSSIYSYGREVRLAVEQARKTVARLLNAYPAEIFFTSGGTESTNTAISAAVHDLGVRHIISSRLEHHATLHTVEHFGKRGNVTTEWVNLLPDGHIDLDDLERRLTKIKDPVLVSLMHANNEIGNMLDLQKAGEICQKYNAYFHSDTVQTVGHYPFDLKNTPVHFVNGAAHKFHGPKGVGMLYINKRIHISPFIHGGSQERNMRAGTENVYGIVGFARALELAHVQMREEKEKIGALKRYFADQLTALIPGVAFNGDPFGQCLYTVLSVAFPKTEKSEMLLFNLDINNICASGGSACTSGAQTGSHVIAALAPADSRTTVRFSFSRNNSKEEVDRVVSLLKDLV